MRVGNLDLESWRWMFSRGILHFPYWNNIKERRERKGFRSPKALCSALLCCVYDIGLIRDET